MTPTVSRPVTSAEHDADRRKRIVAFLHHFDAAQQKPRRSRSLRGRRLRSWVRAFHRQYGFPLVVQRQPNGVCVQWILGLEHAKFVRT